MSHIQRTAVASSGSLTKEQEEKIAGVPAGGAKGQVLTKKTATSYDDEWAAPAGGAPSGAAGGDLEGSEYPNPVVAAEKITTGKIKLLAVTAGLLAAEAVETGKIKALAITEGLLGAEAVTTAKIKLLAVTEALLASEAVTAAKLATNAVEEAKIKALAVTEGKIAGEAVTAGKIATGAVTEGKLGAEAVTNAKVKKETLEPNRLVAATIKEASKERAINTAFEPSAAEPIDVGLVVRSKEVTAYTLKVEVGATVVVEMKMKAAAVAIDTFVWFRVPAGQSWKVPTTAQIEKLFSTYYSL